MKGFLGAALALSLLALVFMSSSAHVSNSRAFADSRADALMLERDYYRRAEARGALLLALSGADSGEAASLGLSEVAGLLKGEYAHEGADAVVWCGLATDGEIEALSEEMVLHAIALPCTSCWEAGSLVAGTCCTGEECRPDFISPCALILAPTPGGMAVVGTEGVRMTDAGEACAYPEVVLARWKKSAVGASIYDSGTGNAGVALIPQGLVVGK